MHVYSIEWILVLASFCFILSNAFVVAPFSFFSTMRDNPIVLRLHSPDLSTNFEYLLRQRHPSSTTSFIDPDTCMIPSTSRKPNIGFDINDPKDNDSPPLKGLRLPLYPISAVHLPSEALHTLNNVEHKNVQMAHHLRKGMWKIVGTEGNFFVNTLLASDTKRLASIGTLMEVVEMEDITKSDGKLIRIRLVCKARGLVKILGLEKQNEFEYMVGRFGLLEPYGLLQENESSEEEDNLFISSSSLLDIPNGDIQRILLDYHTVRSMYIDLEGVASRELPPFARDHVQSHLSTFSIEDFVDPIKFWNVADCWQMLCNTVREARRCDLQSDINEVMIESEMKKGGMLKLPIKRESLGSDVQMVLNKIEQDACEEFHSLGMDPCLNFQVLIGMCDDYNISCHHKRLLFLGELIAREKDRIQTKGMLKVLFDNSKTWIVGAPEKSTDDTNGNHFA